jgi:hypothetical protein
MLRNLNIILIFTSVLALIGVYALKYNVEETASTKMELEHSINRQVADLSMLKADWAYLNQPTHIDPILKRHAEMLGLQVINQKQFGSMAQLPMRPVIVPDTQALDDLFASLDAGVDPLNAGAETIAGQEGLPPSQRAPTATVPGPEPVVPATRPSRLASRPASRPVMAAPEANPDPLGALIESVED